MWRLGVGKDFTTWIKGRISKYDFIENEDYKLDSPKRGNQKSHGKEGYWALVAYIFLILNEQICNKVGLIDYR
ncbi:MAG: antA/AntB antirepressor family protein [Alphaproteobacteria bacterium]|nr:antA/AntB antirepressor family protein [Alphaproteobacteria bacterium]MBQ6886268.1 antA/AntB antirepressor family protein [Lachnospiraceae bacterium]